MRHAFSIDVEDWFDGIPVPKETKAAAECRLDRGMGVLLDLLDRFRTRATFFLLGPIARDHPDMVRGIAAAGHEIGCHGWSHDLLYEMGPERFRDETRRAMDTISDITGAPVRAYRAAYFSVTERSLWALEILADLGFRYDSSIFPVKNWRYGIADFDPRPQRLDTPSGTICELPVSVRKVMGRNIAASGGAYFRIYPYALTRSNVRESERRGRPVNFYLHPWELDPDHPRIPFHWKARATHYVNLRSTEPKLRTLLRDFEFGPLGEVLEHELAGDRSRSL
ncbi:MAG TPA: XrtA system polysaccharide deacetylase [bacterium]|nr:XrtA system polysaccharide deacetylase [bacterium]